MRHLINKLTGGDMWVADGREKEYLEAGHKKPVSVLETEKPSKAAVLLQKPDVAEKSGAAEKPKPKSRAVRRKSNGIRNR